jgi:hypothetical protein
MYGVYTVFLAGKSVINGEYIQFWPTLAMCVSHAAKDVLSVSAIVCAVAEACVLVH